jgi:hypothetical protein
LRNAPSQISVTPVCARFTSQMLMFPLKALAPIREAASGRRGRTGTGRGRTRCTAQLRPLAHRLRGHLLGAVRNYHVCQHGLVGGPAGQVRKRGPTRLWDRLERQAGVAGGQGRVVHEEYGIRSSGSTAG